MTELVAVPLLGKLLGAALRQDPHSTRDVAGNGASARSELLAEANAHHAQGRYGAALTAINRALIVSPDDPELLLARASTLYVWGRLREAREACLRAKAQGLRSTTLSAILGWSCIALSRLDEAEEAMRMALEIDPDAWEAHCNLAIVMQ